MVYDKHTAVQDPEALGFPGNTYVLNSSLARMYTTITHLQRTPRTVHAAQSQKLCLEEKATKRILEPSRMRDSVQNTSENILSCYVEWNSHV